MTEKLEEYWFWIDAADRVQCVCANEYRTMNQDRIALGLKGVDCWNWEETFGWFFHAADTERPRAIYHPEVPEAIKTLCLVLNINWRM